MASEKTTKPSKDTAEASEAKTTANPETAENALADKASSAKKTVTEKASKAKKTVTEKASKAKKAVTEKASKTKDTVTEKASKAKDTVTEKASKAKASVKKNVSTGKEKAKATVAKISASQETYFEIAGEQILMEDINEKIRQAWLSEGHYPSRLKSIKTYLNIEERRAYYVINGKAENKYVEF